MVHVTPVETYLLLNNDIPLHSEDKRPKKSLYSIESIAVVFTGSEPLSRSFPVPYSGRHHSSFF